MFVVAFAQIEPEDVEKADIETKAEYIITMTWPHDDSNDVDIWVEDPTGNLINFRNKERGLTHLDRDDLGKNKDFFMTPDGHQVFYDYNQEIVTIRGIIPGQWIINIHMYRVNQNIKPSIVHVKIEKLNPKVTTIVDEKITLTKHWQEETVARLMMSKDGSIITVNKIPSSLIKKQADMSQRRQQAAPSGPGE